MGLNNIELSKWHRIGLSLSCPEWSLKCQSQTIRTCIRRIACLVSKMKRRSISMLKPQYAEASVCRSLRMSKPQYVETSICRSLRMVKTLYAEASLCRSFGLAKPQYVKASVCQSLNTKMKTRPHWPICTVYGSIIKLLYSIYCIIIMPIMMLGLFVVQCPVIQ